MIASPGDYGNPRSFRSVARHQIPFVCIRYEFIDNFMSGKVIFRVGGNDSAK